MYISDEKVQRIWSTICDHFRTDIPFKVKEARLVLEREFGYSPRTAEQYVSQVLKLVEAQPVTEDVPQQVKKIGIGRWVLPSIETASH